MGPKVHQRTTSSSKLGPNSRSASASRLGTNLQFTQREPSKKNVVTDKRLNNSKDQRSVYAAAPKTKPKKGFIIASSPSDEADDDEWVSSESGAATPNDLGGSELELTRPELEPEPEPEPEPPAMAVSVDNDAPVLRNKRHSGRPPSTHSISGILRPHPLIRGQSYGLPSNAMTSDVASAQLASTAPVNISPISAATSPTATVSSPSSSPSNHHQIPSRRTSVSSARSVATLPVLREPPRQPKDRNRTISYSSSSAAISSLAHIPATRPSSPQRLSVNFPPPSHPQFHTAGVHSLLPPPYLSNHLTTLAHRTPLRESYDRVRRAKLEARR